MWSLAVRRRLLCPGGRRRAVRAYDAPVSDPEEPTIDDAMGASIDDAEEASLAHRLRDRRRLVEARIGATRDRLEASRPQSGVVDTVFRAVEVDASTGGGVLSAAVAFRFFLFMVPFVFFVVVGLGFASEAVKGDPAELARSAGVAGLIASAVRGAGDLDTWERVTTILVSGFALLLTSRATVKVLRISHGLIWRVPIPRLANLTRAAAVFIGLVTIEVVAGLEIARLRTGSVALWLLGLAISGVLPAGIWWAVSIWLPHAECPRWALLPGAAVVGVGAVALHAATVYWFAYQVESKSETYGAIGVALSLLLWAYLLGRIITLAAAVNSAFWYRNEERLGHPVPDTVDLDTRLESGLDPLDQLES